MDDYAHHINSCGIRGIFSNFLLYSVPHLNSVLYKHECVPFTKKYVSNFLKEL